MKILLVDDDPVVRILVGEFLSAKGHEVETSVDGESAMKVLAEAGHIPDVLIVDFMMPGMSGAELLNSVREMNSTLPIVMLSADKSNLESIGDKANLTLEKPFALPMLEKALHDIVS